MSTNWNIIIKLQAINYENPSNCVNDLKNIVKNINYIKNIELINAEKLIYNKQSQKYEKQYYDYSK